MIDILEVGVGGGSIAWLDDQRSPLCRSAQRRLHAGPGLLWTRGRVKLTVTDANLLLGRLDPEDFLGGEMRLAFDAGCTVLAERIAVLLGYAGADAVTRAARGVLRCWSLAGNSDARSET